MEYIGSLKERWRWERALKEKKYIGGGDVQFHRCESRGQRNAPVANGRI